MPVEVRAEVPVGVRAEVPVEVLVWAPVAVPVEVQAGAGAHSESFVVPIQKWSP
ncbi:MAG TPA: hypothetical protein HPP81_09425 [Deltaproteobacteria bacterium]|nr:hypothetical protein [Deltaproteobacteria bacterium]